MSKKILTATMAVVIVLSAGALGWILTGCSKDTTTGPATPGTMVNMSVSFSKSGTPGLMKGLSALGADSLRIDSAVVILSRIKFLLHADSVSVDTGDAEHDSLDRDGNIVFRGPFVIHVHDTVAIDLGSNVLPAGTYDGIKFKIHRLLDGEHHEDCDGHRHHQSFNDSSVVGSSITVWGAVYKDSGWTNFRFDFNDELEFKVKGNFVVPDSTSTVNIALNIDMGAWFKNPFNGTLLDPTDHSFFNRHLIREAIREAFGACRGGHDRGDGHPRD